MIGGMEADEIDAAPVAVVGVELGRVLVRQSPQLQEIGRPGAGAERFEAAGRPRPALPRDRLPQRLVGIVKIILGELDRLVEDFVRLSAVRVEGRAGIVLSVSQQDSHGFSPIFRTLRW